MKSDSRPAISVLTGIALTAAVGISSAQTPAQMEYERQQREYRLQQERQREQQQQQQQLMNENARRQQEQSSRSNAPAGQSPSYAPPANTGLVGRGTRDWRRRPERRTGGVGRPRNVGEASCAAARSQSAAR